MERERWHLPDGIQALHLAAHWRRFFLFAVWLAVQQVRVIEVFGVRRCELRPATATEDVAPHKEGSGEDEDGCDGDADEGGQGDVGGARGDGGKEVVAA